jgi:hypothetical protein
MRRFKILKQKIGPSHPLENSNLEFFFQKSNIKTVCKMECSKMRIFHEKTTFWQKFQKEKNSL